jgi:hypothetical protein
MVVKIEKIIKVGEKDEIRDLVRKGQTEISEKVVLNPNRNRGGGMPEKSKPIKEGKAETTEKIIQDSGKKGATESPERIVKPPQKPKDKN